MGVKTTYSTQSSEITVIVQNAVFSNINENCDFHGKRCIVLLLVGS